MPKHTPGPWGIVDITTNKSPGFRIQYAEDGECITDHVYDLHDAHLIKAAPNMLAALKELIHLHLCDMEGMLPVKPEAWAKAVDDAADAIEEATGGRE